MESNSSIFSTSVFGVNSGDTTANIMAKNTQTIETFFVNQGTTKMNNKTPVVPSNQRIARDK